MLLARVEFKMPEDFLNTISRLEERTDEIIPRVLEAGGKVVLDKVRSNLRAVIGRDLKKPSRSTGQLVSTLGLSPAKLDRNGNFDVKVGFNEPRRGGVSNAMVGSILEYGKHGQRGKPFMKPAKSASREACIAAMVSKLEEEIGNI